MDELAAAAIPIPPEYRDAVLEQWRSTQAMAAPLLDFDLPGDAMPAPIFHP